MPPDLPHLDVTDAELAVLQTLWDNGPSTIRQLADILYPGGKAAQYGTVQKLLERLEGKGCVKANRNPGVWPHVFTSAVDRDTLIGWQLRRTAEKLCGGSMTPLLLHLLHTEPFSTQERQELRSFLERLRQDAAKKS
jgi:predicted transcriptional regulator